jgi:hypothetical protein
MKAVLEAILSISKGIRYAAIYYNGSVTSSSRRQLENASSNESDKYEELIVNPTLLTLVSQRGNIDCGGAGFVLIRYGNFFEFIKSIRGGHISVGMELTQEPIQLIPQIEEVVESQDFLT